MISRNVKSYHAAINPNLIKNKDNFLIKIRLNFPEIRIENVREKLKGDIESLESAEPTNNINIKK